MEIPSTYLQCSQTQINVNQCRFKITAIVWLLWLAALRRTREYRQDNMLDILIERGLLGWDSVVELGPFFTWTNRQHIVSPEVCSLKKEEKNTNGGNSKTNGRKGPYETEPQWQLINDTFNKLRQMEITKEQKVLSWVCAWETDLLS